MRKLFVLAVMAALVLAVAIGVARADHTISGGNDTIDRLAGPDSWDDFSIIDTNTPIDSDGVITSWTIYAKNTRDGRSDIKLKVYRPTGGASFLVVGQSALKTPLDSSGEQTFALSTPILVKAGDVVGMRIDGQGWVPYTITGTHFVAGDVTKPVKFTTANNGANPDVVTGSTATAAASGDRVYSIHVSGFGLHLSASPGSDVNPVGTSHTVTADIGADVAGVTVNFDVIGSGPNDGDSGTDATDSDGEATFTYPGDGGAGADTIRIWVDLDSSGDFDSSEDVFVEVTKTWYDGVASGGGAIVDDSGATKRKDWRHISFGGAVYRIGPSDYDVIGEWETVFHNTSVSGINGKTFTASTIDKVVFAGTSGEVARIVAPGTLDGVPDYVLVVRAEDAGEPGSHCAATDPPSFCDNIRFSLFFEVSPSVAESTACGNVYDTSNATLGACTFDATNEEGDFPDQSDSFGTERTFLDSGNLQVATLP